MTLKQFVLLGERHKHRVQREDRRAGEMIAMFYNANRDIEKDPNGIEWQDVFPEWKDQPEELDDDEMFERMMLLAKPKTSD